MPRRAQKTAPSIIQVVGGSTPAVAGFMPPMPPPLDPLSSTLTVLNANPYIIGVFYIFLNLGGRFLSMELTKRQEWFLAQPYVRPFILFSVMFIATRNLAVAFWSTTGILAVLWVFANENSSLCLIPGWRTDAAKKEEEEKTYDEKMKAVQKHAHEDHHDHPPHEEEHHDESHEEHHEDHHETT
jgi:hypothetical protein